MKLNKVRGLDFFSRVFRPIEKGSLRGVVVYWVRMTMGVGILTLPKLIEQVGYVIGALFLLLGCIICYFSYKSIFFASDTTKIDNYAGLVEELLPNFIFKIFRVTYYMDMQAFTIVYAIFGWKIFEFLIESFNLQRASWYV